MLIRLHGSDASESRERVSAWHLIVKIFIQTDASPNLDYTMGLCDKEYTMSPEALI